ncbi:cytochrome c biogenesis protein CcdA [Corynebacterium caspium]|uniref:cytochrome c biogenesis protein CcdA n=1 Tax=Corynebacterium caspium TaxID=234828 RepID=UPI0003734886|nr:cytochrome c biogenesis protein CcdA [Corynebacterium caspium]WKD58599.1 Thiol-disulfide oxidoreductase YkuV [Corynebacterium caspium DSM 44850]
MFSNILVGLLGGLITGISPCILPILPIIFLSGANSATAASLDPAGAAPRKSASRYYPLLVVSGLVVSFTAVTLLGSTLLNLLGLPQDFIRWMGIVLLAVIGIALMFPKLEELLERPFLYIRSKQANRDSNGFVFGLVLGTAFIPCAGPVLTAISVAGSTGKLGWDTFFLGFSFAIGVAIPLFFFASAGQKATERISGYQRHQRLIRTLAGIAMLALSVGLVLNVPAKIQRLIPDYTAGLQQGTDRLLHADSTNALCEVDGTQLADCGPQPEITGIVDWFNTPDEQPLAHAVPAGGVRIVDFWAYSCINCQRSIPGIEKLYEHYNDAGLQVIGVHSPEYAFEKVPANVRAGAQDLGITYPVAVDSDLATWQAFDNHYWPAQYLVDESGKIRFFHFGEGGEELLEEHIRELLSTQQPGVELPAPLFTAEKMAAEKQVAMSQAHINPETYLFPQRAKYYQGQTAFQEGTHDYGAAQAPEQGRFTLAGKWTADKESVTPAAETSEIALGLHAHHVYLVASGKGEISYTFQGQEYRKMIDGVPNGIDLLPGDDLKEGPLEIKVTGDVHLHSFTFG